MIQKYHYVNSIVWNIYFVATTQEKSVMSLNSDVLSNFFTKTEAILKKTHTMCFIEK